MLVDLVVVDQLVFEVGVVLCDQWGGYYVVGYGIQVEVCEFVDVCVVVVVDFYDCIEQCGSGYIDDVFVVVVDQFEVVVVVGDYGCQL